MKFSNSSSNDLIVPVAAAKCPPADPPLPTILFGLIPIKVPSKNGDYYIEFGGSLQNQTRLYFGPVNIRKMTIQLMNDRGDVIDLNNSNWSFSFICEQL